MEQRNLLLAIVLSVAILLGFELLYYGSLGPNTQQSQQQASQQGRTGDGQTGTGQTGGGTTPQAQSEAGQAAGVPGGGAAGTGIDAPSRDQVLAGEDPRIAIETPKLTGSISLIGARVDDITLKNYRHELDPDSERIHLLNPRGAREAYYATFGWSGVRGAGVELPGPNTRWEASGGPLEPGRDVTLRWTNDSGLTFERVYGIDEDYMITVTQRVTNATDAAISLAPYGLISRRGTPQTSGFYILHEGPLGVLQGTLDERSYGTLRDDGISATETTGGWIGITDKYWLVSLVPDQDKPITSRFVHTAEEGVDKYQTDILYETVQVQPGGTVSQTSRLFAGAKEVAVLDRYKEELGVPMFDKAVDFGWLYFMNKPLFQVLKFFQDLTGNFGVAILILVVFIKIIFFPLANKSYRSMAKLRRLQPEMQRLREQFGDDKQRLNQEMMALYKNEGANPASGCLPILIQIPVFFALYKVLLVTIEMRHAPFFGWIQDLSAKDPTAITNLFGLMPWGVPELGPLDIFNIGILPIIMGVTMYAQQMLNPQPTDPMQAKIFKFLPVVFTFLLAQFPAGLVLYWTWNNLLTVGQQYIIMKRAGDKPGAKAAPAPAKGKQSEAEKAGDKGGGKTAKAGDGGDGGGSAPAGGNGAAGGADGEAPAPAGAVPAGAASAEAGGSVETAAAGDRAGGGHTPSGNPAAKSGKGKGKGKKGRRK